MTSRRRTIRRKRHRGTPSVRRTIFRGLLTAAIVGVIVYFGVTAYNGVPFRAYTTLYVEVPEVGNLIKHDPVQVGGVRVGQVQSSVVRGGRARVVLQIEPGVTFPADTKVAVRANGLLGARYVELRPGTSRRTLASGATIRSDGDVLSYGLAETLDTLDTRTRGRLHDLVRSLGQGTLSRGADLNAGIRAASSAVGPLSRLTDRLLEPSAHLAELTPALVAGVTPLDDARDDLGRLLDPLDRGLRPLVDRRDELHAALDQAPSTLRALDGGLHDARPLLAALRSVAVEAQQTLPMLPAGLRATTAFLRDAPRPLRRTRALVTAADDAVPELLRLTSALRPLLDPLRQTGEHASPILRGLAPYGCDIITWAINFRSMTGFAGPGGSSRGPFMGFRAQVVPSPEILSALGRITPPGQPPVRTYDKPCSYPPREYPFVVGRLPLNPLAKGGK